MTACAFAIPGDLAQPTGGYAYARRVLALLPGLGVEVSHLHLPGSFPSPNAAELEEAAALLAAVPASSVALIDGLAFGVLPPEVLAQMRAPIVALVHHPLGWESGLDAARRAALIDSERRALAFARRVIVSSSTTARLLVEAFGVTAQHIVVAEPGTDPAPAARGSGGVPHLLAVGAVVPRKGYDVLVAALAGLAERDWTASIVGSLDRAPQTAAALAAQIEACGLTHRIRLVGMLDDAALARAYDTADIFVLASRYEGYGMVLAEAMARGLPIVATAAGAAAETVPPGAGLLVAPDDAVALRVALNRLLADAGLRQNLAAGARTAGAALPRWETSVVRVAGAIVEASREGGR